MLSGLARRYEMPVLAIHAPVLLFTQFVWGRDQRVKLQKSAELARDVGATTVVVHPPFRWQSGYAENFLDIVRELAADTGVEIAVENMFPWKVSGRSLQAYLPGIDPVVMDCDAITLDFSHAALARLDSLEMAKAAGFDGTAAFAGESYDAAALMLLAMQAAKSSDPKIYKDKITDVANAPGEKIGPGELGKALELIAAGTDIEYDGASSVEMIGPGESAGAYREVDFKGGTLNAVKFR